MDTDAIGSAAAVEAIKMSAAQNQSKPTPHAQSHPQAHPASSKPAASPSPAASPAPHKTAKPKKEEVEEAEEESGGGGGGGSAQDKIVRCPCISAPFLWLMNWCVMNL